MELEKELHEYHLQRIKCNSRTAKYVNQRKEEMLIKYNISEEVFQEKYQDYINSLIITYQPR